MVQWAADSLCVTVFFDSSTAANGHFINEGSTIANVGAGGTQFRRQPATADHGTFTNDGGKGNGAGGGSRQTFFGGSSTAA